VSLREVEASKHGLQGSLSCPGISARSDVVVVMVFLLGRGIACHNATVLVMTALLARWRFTNCPA
jgi:hypothetical protein